MDTSDGGLLADFNFDGYLDMCLRWATAANSYYRLCWLLSTSEKTESW